MSIVRAWVGAACVALAIAGCGGGGGDSAPAANNSTPATDNSAPAGDNSTPAVQILDSFGLTVAAGGADGIGGGDSGADGTAGEGAPIVGARVEVTDVNAKTAVATADSQGYYRVKVTGFTPPFVAKVTKSNGNVLHSLNVAPLKVNGFVTVNITGLTDKVASDVARAGGKSGAADLTPQIVASQSAVIARSIESLRTQIAPVIAAAGIPAASFDPLAVAFRADRTGYDFVLDNVKVTVAADGSTEVALAPAFALSGTWQLKLDEEPDFVVGQFPGANVPTAQQVAQQTPSAVVAKIFATDARTDQYTFTQNGNTVTLTGPNTNYQIVINSLSFSGYQSCGACGVGSQVAFVAHTSLTETGTLNGQTNPAPTTLVETFTFRYTRVN